MNPFFLINLLLITAAHALDNYEDSTILLFCCDYCSTFHILAQYNKNVKYIKKAL